jgi:hypothetical protein
MSLCEKRAASHTKFEARRFRVRVAAKQTACGIFPANHLTNPTKTDDTNGMLATV